MSMTNTGEIPIERLIFDKNFKNNEAIKGLILPELLCIVPIYIFYIYITLCCCNEFKIVVKYT